MAILKTMISLSTLSLLALVFVSVYWLAKRALWRYIVSTTTILDDLPRLGTASSADKQSGTVVIAGGRSVVTTVRVTN